MRRDACLIAANKHLFGEHGATDRAVFAGIQIQHSSDGLDAGQAGDVFQLLRGIALDPGSGRVKSVDWRATTQVETLKRRFRLASVVLAGDRGMITSARIAEDLKPAGLDWISCLRAPQIRDLVAAGPLQL